MSNSPLIDNMWKFTWPLRPSHPSWSETIHRGGKNAGKSTNDFLPIIDLNPSDLFCVYTTLKLIAKQARVANSPCIITFDQLLRRTSLQIINSKPTDNILNIIALCLGGFHTITSFLWLYWTQIQGLDYQKP